MGRGLGFELQHALFQRGHPMIPIDIDLGAQPDLSTVDRSMILSPVDKLLVIVSTGPDGTSRLYRRRLDSSKAEPLPGTEGAFLPFFKPDGTWIGFFTADGQLKKTPVDGGGVITLCPEDLQRQLDVHYIGAVLAIGSAASVMRRQGLGGSIVASVSKAAMAPGKDAAAYGGSKAALLQAMRVAAVELGGDGIRVNAINADQVETPLFQAFVEERAAMRGVSVEDQLEAYRRRNVLGVSLIPETVADFAALLASSRFSYTTGDIITVDGGLPEAFPR